MIEDISVEHIAVDQHIQDVAEPPKVVVALSYEHAEAVASTLEEGHKPLPVVEYVQVYDTEVVARRCCYSLPNIPSPS